MISSDMPELVSMSDRVLVIMKGNVAGTLEGEEIAEKNIISKMIVGH
jgi:ribose transport system ATP-binding protein